MIDIYLTFAWLHLIDSTWKSALFTLALSAGESVLLLEVLLGGVDSMYSVLLSIKQHRFSQLRTYLI